MNCVTSRKFLDAHVDGELEAGMMLQMDRHMDECLDCASLFKLTSGMKRQLGLLGEAKAPDRLREKVLSARRPGLGMRIAWVAVPLAAAAAILLAVLPNRSDSSGERVAQVVSDVVERHMRELPMEIKDKSGQKAANWFQGKVDFPVRPLAPGIRNASLEGARVSNVREHQAAHMVYTIDGKKVTFMVFPSDDLAMRGGDVRVIKGHRYLTGRRNGYNVAMTREGDMIYAVSSELPAQRLLTLLSNRR